MKKLETVDLKGKEYATVPTRTKQFRSECPNGLIETTPIIQPDGMTVIFTARILKDKSNPYSGEATGHSIGKLSGDKAFEKLETVAIGRALAILGYMASGDIASSEEMEEFIAYQENKKIEARIQAIEKLQSCSSLQELQDVWKSLGTIIQDKEVVAKKDELKAKLK